MLIEIYTFKDRVRYVETKQYNKICDWEKDYLILKMTDQWAGHKIYNCTKQKFDAMTPVERANAVVAQKFDKSAYINKGAYKDGKKN
jgi:hypothetical protein